MASVTAWPFFLISSFLPLFFPLKISPFFSFSMSLSAKQTLDGSVVVLLGAFETPNAEAQVAGRAVLLHRPETRAALNFIFSFSLKTLPVLAGP